MAKPCAEPVPIKFAKALLNDRKIWYNRNNNTKLYYKVKFSCLSEVNI